MSDSVTERLPGVRVVAKRMGFVVVATVVGLAIGLGVQTQRPVDYQSTALLTVDSTGNQDPLAAARAAQAIARVVTAPSVVSSELRDAGLTREADRPQISVLSQAAPDAPLISVSGIAASPDRALRVARVTVSSIRSLPSVGQYETVVVAAPTLPTQPLTPRWLLPAGIAGLVFGASTLLAAVLPVAARRREDERP